ncbi:MAG TPA: methyltransferase [Vicinamibacterales bacterium]|nr:methyltransferase [Vicinamibacterales bacterium]
MSSVLADQSSIAAVLQFAGGAVLNRCLHAVANLGIADALGDTPQSADMLADATGTNSDALARALRLLAANGVFAYRDGLFSHSPLSRLLRADHPQSMRPLVRMFGLPAFWTMIGDIEYSIRTGQPAGNHVLEGGVWGYLSSDAEASRVFDDSMTAKAHAQVAGVVESYDFSGVATIGDIGGGRGHLLRAILDKTPSATGVLFDQPHVVDHVEASGRMKKQGGDFFADTMPACDIYLLMEVIHDWDDQRALQILNRIRASAALGARVLLIEALIPETSGPNWPLTLDLWMLTISGKQRTLEEYAALLAGAGFRFTKVVNTGAGVSIVEGTV